MKKIIIALTGLFLVFMTLHFNFLSDAPTSSNIISVEVEKAPAKITPNENCAPSAEWDPEGSFTECQGCGEIYGWSAPEIHQCGG